MHTNANKEAHVALGRFIRKTLLVRDALLLSAGTQKKNVDNDVTGNLKGKNLLVISAPN